MKAISLYSGAGGMDVGFVKAGFEPIWANDFNKDACETYKLNFGAHIKCGSIDDFLGEVNSLKKIDIIYGGPPCQGFSVAGKMDPSDPRSRHIWTFCDIVEKVKPNAFVMENVKALGVLSKWEPIRIDLLKRFKKLGYSANYIVVNSKDYDCPQARERVFFVGFKTFNPDAIPDLGAMLAPYMQPGLTVRESLKVLDKAGTGNNKGVCNAKITIAPNPILRRSPYAGMLFNGMGRPVKIDGYCATLPASMGGNKTPIIDEIELYQRKKSWVEEYHSKIWKGVKPLDFQEAPKRLRRLTVEEASILQTFPIDYHFFGSQSSRFRQIGNAVPCNLAYAVAQMVKGVINSNNKKLKFCKTARQMEIELN
jgi:DNA (cytosine-5)-methyltransferase 1